MEGLLEKKLFTAPVHRFGFPLEELFSLPAYYIEDFAKDLESKWRLILLYGSRFADVRASCSQTCTLHTFSQILQSFLEHKNVLIASKKRTV